ARGGPPDAEGWFPAVWARLAPLTGAGRALPYPGLGPVRRRGAGRPASAGPGRPGRTRPPPARMPAVPAASPLMAPRAGPRRAVPHPVPAAPLARPVTACPARGSLRAHRQRPADSARCAEVYAEPAAAAAQLPRETRNRCPVKGVGRLIRTYA